MKDIEESVRTILTAQLEISEDMVTIEADFQRDLGMDSLEFVELLLTVEEKLQIEIDDEVAEGIETVGDLIASVKALIAKKEPPVPRVAQVAVWEQMGCAFWGGRCR
ncbi:MAG: acyl carrier protein [bacterium]|nr:acyl carrier protein [bacterium]